MRIASIDPGKNGAICIIVDGMPETFYGMPTVEIGSKTLPCPDKVAEIMTENKIELVVIEQVGASPRMGVASAFNFGYGFGAMVGMCAGLLIPHATISPQKWKRVQALMGKEKDESRLKAIKCYPYLTEYLKRKKDCDRADAMWIGLSWIRLSGDNKWTS